jgi:hypothetical protein
VPGFFVPDFPAAHMLGVNSSHDGRNRHESASELLPSHAAALRIKNDNFHADFSSSWKLKFS